jgi:hypothetical protein
MALHCCTNSVLGFKGPKTPLSSHTASRLTGFIVLDCAPVQAECVALFSASATENRLKHLDGFEGAVFFASPCGRFVLEYVLWKDPAALAAARAIPLFSEHMRIVEHHCRLRHVSFSSISNTFESDTIRFERGDRFSVLVYEFQAGDSLPKALDQLGSVPEIARAHSLFQMAEDGKRLVLLSRDAIDTSTAPALRAMFGEPAFHNEFTVVESIAPPNVGDRFAALYHLALVPEQSSERPKFK